MLRVENKKGMRKSCMFVLNGEDSRVFISQIGQSWIADITFSNEEYITRENLLKGESNFGIC